MRNLVVLLFALMAAPAISFAGSTDDSGLGAVEDEGSFEACCNAGVASNAAVCERWAEQQALKQLGIDPTAPKTETPDAGTGAG